MCLCKQSSMGIGIGVCMCDVCVIINQISSRQLLVCVCNGSTPGRAVNARTRCVCVREHIRLRLGMSVCVWCVCVVRVCVVRVCV